MKKFLKQLFKKRVEKVCVICGKKFKTKNYSQKVCGKVCKKALVKNNSTRAYYKAKALKMVKNTTKVILDNGITKVVLNTSKNKAKRKYSMNPLKLKTKKCVICGKAFRTSNNKAITCSKKCRAERLKERNKIYMRKYYAKQRAMKCK